MSLFTVITLVVLSLYFLLILLQIFTFPSSGKKQKSNSESQPISIVIPFRNEANRILKTIDSINALKGNQKNLEVIWVNDHSDDDGVVLIQKNCKVNFKVIENSGTGKKGALHTGVTYAQHDWIATLDADIELHSNWLSTLRNSIDDQKQFLIMPVIIGYGTTCLNKIEQLDILSLTGTTFSWASFDKPIMCNGANLAFKKESFLALRKKLQNEEGPSGDDVFFLHQVKKANPQSIDYVFHEEVIATTAPQAGVSNLLNQRVRWASKSLRYKDTLTLLIAIVVGLNHLVLSMSLIAALFNFSLIKLFLIAYAVKFFIDFIYLALVANRLGQLSALSCYPVAAVFQLIMTNIVVVKSLFSKYTWKGRQY